MISPLLHVNGPPFGKSEAHSTKQMLFTSFRVVQCEISVLENCAYMVHVYPLDMDMLLQEFSQFLAMKSF
jgi:hypothetical protein